jgi:phosphopantothenoylcysteine decarboxylase / phosphopantothenate---cysteine ligase
VAAVADYHVVNASSQKIKKGGGNGMTLELAENPDILAHVANLPKGPFCVGFAAETEKLAANAKEKRAKKKIPLLAANLAQQALGADDNEITLYDDAGEHPLGRGSKIEQARKLIGHVASLIQRGKRGA